MIEQLIGFGSAALEVGGKVAPMFSAISGIAGWLTRNQILEQLEKHNRTLERIADDILFARNSTNIILPTSPEVIDFRRVNHLLLPVQKALKTPIVASAFLRTPQVTREQLERNAWDSLDDVRPISKATFDRAPDWIPFLFDSENQIYVGWQKKGTVKSSFGFEMETQPEAWVAPIEDESEEVPEAGYFYVGGQFFDRRKNQYVGERTGTIKFYNGRYGFVIPDGGGRDVYLHSNVVAESGANASPSPGQRVAFISEEAKKGEAVCAVRLLASA